MLRGAIYTRMSRDVTGEGAGVARQELDCRTLAEAKDIEITGVYSDNDISAYSGKRRPGYQDLLSAIRTGQVDVVVCWHTDRLYRRVSELEDYIVSCQANDVPTYAVQAGHLDLATPAGRMTARTLGAVAQYESEHKAERQRRANLQRALQGKHFGTRRCFGYELDGMTVRQAEADAIRFAYDSLIDGTMSLADIGRDWNSRGLSTPQAGNDWESSTVSLTLRTTRLAGIRSYRRAPLIDPGSGEPVRGEWPAIVDEETWAAAQAILSLRHGAPWTSPSLLAGVAVCAVCQEPIWSGGTHKGRRRYRCSAGSHFHREAEPIEALVVRVLLARLAQPDVVGLVTAAPSSEVDVAALRQRIAELRKRSDGLVDAFADGTVSELQLRRGQNRIREEIERLEARIPVPAAIRPVLKLVGGLTPDTSGRGRERWEALSTGEQRAVIRALMNVTIHPTGGKERAYLGDFHQRIVNPDTVTIEWRTTPPPIEERRYRTVRPGVRE